jgi:hypothetical protein
MADEKEAQTPLNDILTSFIGLLKDTKDFVMKEAPAVLREIVVFYRALYTLQFIGGLLFVVGGLILLHQGYCVPHEIKEGYNGFITSKDTPDFAIFLWVMAGISGLVGIVSMGCMLEAVLQIWLAPKVFLLEYISRMLP